MELLDLREFGKSLSDNRSLRGCGRRIRCSGVGNADEILDTTVYCDRAWLCPVCGWRASRDQVRKLAQTLISWTSQGGAVALLTLTQGHTTEDEAGHLWDRLESGWAAMVRGSGWRDDRESFGLRGYVRVTEVVHHPHRGWNVHFHVPLLLHAAIGDQRLYELKDRLAARFTRQITAAGGRAVSAGQDLVPMQPHSEHQVACYYAKGATERRNSDGSRTPMAILADLKEAGEGLHLWKEFSTAVTDIRRRRYSPSQGIDKLVPRQP
jgi:hypothetical protein